MCKKKTTHASGGAHKVMLKGTKPILFILDPSDENPEDFGGKIDDLENAGGQFIKLWILNHIQCALVKNMNEAKPIAYRTDYEGCLVLPHDLRPPGKDPWAGLEAKRKGKANQFQFAFSTISLHGLPVSDLFRKYCLPDASTGIAPPSDPLDLERPYWVPSTGNVPEERLIWGKYHVITFPLKSVGKTELGAFDYWESVIFRNSEYGPIKEAREGSRRNEFSKEILERLKTKTLPDVRGRCVAGVRYRLWMIHHVALWNGEPQYVDGKMNPATYSDLPFIVDGAQQEIYGKPSGCRDLLARGSASASSGGPYWLESSYFNDTEVRSEEDLGRAKIKKRIHVYDMSRNVQEAVPQPLTNVPSVSDDAFFQRFRDAALRDAFFLGKETDAQVGRRIKEKIRDQRDNRSVFGCFQIGTGTDWNSCLLEALNNAVLGWKFRVSSSLTDVIKTESVKKSLVMDNYVKFSFDTLSDAFSESVAPLHVYQQIAHWWAGLTDEDRGNIRNASYVTVRGHTSKAGDEGRINHPLRESRAWKTAQSLWHVLRKEFEKAPWRKELLVPVEKHGNIPPKLSAGDNKVPIVYWGESAVPSGTAPNFGTGMVMVLSSDEKIVQDAIRRHYAEHPDDNPEERAAVVGFHQFVPPFYSEVVRERIRLVAAGPIGAYRVLFFNDAPPPDMPKRMLAYVVGARWS